MTPRLARRSFSPYVVMASRALKPHTNNVFRRGKRSIGIKEFAKFQVDGFTLTVVSFDTTNRQRGK